MLATLLLAAAVAAGSVPCDPLPPMPAKPSRARSVTDFGVKPNDTRDQADAIQQALDKLSPGDWLVFPPGRYEQSKSLHVKVPGVVLWGEGATLHATNPADQSVMLEADGASVYKFTLTAVTDERRSAPWQSRIAVFGGSRPGRVLTGNVIRGNQVIEGGPPGSPTANSAGSAGIFVYRASGFLVAENTVSRSLADGIHVTAASSYGQVLKNTVKETGDDFIGLVSYAADPGTKADAIAADLDRRRERGLNHHVRVADNTLSGGYWARGIAVVGGQNITIERNTIERTTRAAAIYLARETAYLTFGVRDVVVRNNVINDVQTTAPAYVAGTVKANAPKTRHGAIEIYAWLFEDEAEREELREAFAVEDLRIEGNTIERTGADGVRIGTGGGKVWSQTARVKEGGSVTRNVTGGSVGRIVLRANKMAGVGSLPIAINNVPTSNLNVACEDNLADGKPAAANLCAGPPPTVQGACAAR